jgi:hypothetical protein
MAVPLLKQVTLGAAIAFGVIGFYESVAFAVVDGLHRSPSFSACSPACRVSVRSPAG